MIVAGARIFSETPKTMMSIQKSSSSRQRWLTAFACGAFITAAQAEVIIGSGAEKSRSSGAVAGPSSSNSAASGMRDKARSQRGGSEAAVPLSTVIDALDTEDGPFGSRPAGAATDTRNRARAYQQQGSNPTPTASGGTGVVPVDIDRMMVDPESNQGKVKSNLDRARAYSKGDGLGVTNQRFGGKENLPLVDCGQVDNTTGRIGDDVSGAVITVQRGNKAVKVRCK
jgi:hypothetical protein